MKKSRARKVKDLRRREAYRNARGCILIVCEGKKTEPYYFRHLRRVLKLHTVEVEITPSYDGPAAISVVDYAIKLRDSREEEAINGLSVIEFDEIWCVVDVESPHPDDSLDRAYNKGIDNRKIYLALSNPCFEYWYILHFDHTGSPMTNAEARKILRSCIGTYKKGDQKVPDIVLMAKGDTEKTLKTAIINAKSVIRERGWGKDLRKCNPSTHVYKVVEKLISLAKKPYPKCAN